MRSNFWKFLIGSFLFFLTGSMFANQIKFNSSTNEFPLFNRNNSKIYKYYLLKPAEKLDFTCKGVDSLIILTRVLIEDNDSVEYQFSLNRDGDSKRIKKQAKKSTVTRGIGGEIVSSYNKLALKVKDYNERFEIYNLSENKILFKLNADIANSSSNTIDYIRFTPSYYEGEKILQIDEKTYTYYSSEKKPMTLILEGPVVLKIISRLIFNSNFVNKKKYRYEVYDNEEMIAEFTEDAYKSTTAILLNEIDRIPSTGDVNIITLDKGIHKIQIKDGAINRDIIFRLYISKSSVGIVN